MVDALAAKDFWLMQGCHLALDQTGCDMQIWLLLDHTNGNSPDEM